MKYLEPCEGLFKYAWGGPHMLSINVRCTELHTLRPRQCMTSSRDRGLLLDYDNSDQYPSRLEMLNLLHTKKIALRLRSEVKPDSPTFYPKLNRMSPEYCHTETSRFLRRLRDHK